MKKIVTIMLAIQLLFATFNLCMASEVDFQNDTNTMVGYEEEYISRAELISMINAKFKISNIQSYEYSDLQPGFWYYNDILAALNNGYISGYSDNTVKPEKLVTFLEAIVMLQKASGISSPVSDEDMKDVVSWGRYAVVVMIKRNIIDENISFDDNVTRKIAKDLLDKVYNQLYFAQKETIDFNNNKRLFLDYDFEWDKVGDVPKGWYSEIPEMVAVCNENKNNYVFINKTAKEKDVQFVKYFEPLAGVVSFEYDVTTKETNGVKYMPAFSTEKERERTISNIYMQNGYFKAYNGSLAVNLMPFLANNWYHVRVDVDIDNKVYDVYIDDLLVANKLAFRLNTVGNVGKIYFSIPSGEVGTLGIDNIALYTSQRKEEALENDGMFAIRNTNIDFQSNEVGVAPEGWKIEKNVAVVSVEKSKETPNKYLVMKKEKPVASGYDRATVDFAKPLSGVVQVDFKFKVDAVPSTWKSMTIADHRIIFAVTGNRLAVQNSSGGLIDIYSGLIANKWYSIKVIANTQDSLFDVYVNGKLCKSDLAFRATTSALNNFFITMDYDSYGILYIDNLTAQVIGQSKKRTVEGFDDNKEVSTPNLSDWIDKYQKFPEGKIIEAEDLTLNGFEVIDCDSAYNKKAIKVKENKNAVAQYLFDLEDGYYSFKVGYVENNEECDTVYRIYQNNDEIDYWFGQFDDGRVHIRDVKNSWYFKKGDIITLEGYYANDPTTFDFICFDDSIETKFDVGYLVEDTFLAPENFKRSAWDISENGGAVRLLWNDGRSFDLLDCNTTEQVWAKRRFIKQENGITSELKFKIPVYADGISISYRNGDDVVLEIVTVNGGLALKKSNSELIPLINNIQPDVLYSGKIEIQKENAIVYFATAKGPISVDLDKKCTVDNLYIQTPMENMAHILFKMVDVYSGYLVNEKFKTYNNDEIVYDWDIIKNAKVVTKANSQSTDWRALKLLPESQFEKKLKIDSDEITSSFEFLMESKGYFEAYFGDVRIFTDGTNLNAKIGNETKVIWQNLKLNQYYNVKIIENENEAVVYVNWIEMMKGKYDGKFDKISFLTKNSDVIIDDICVFDSVIKSKIKDVNPVDTGDYIVGMQACDLWHEGGQFGWESVRPYDNRTPLAGYYDENNMEVGDLEIKWMLEHGINLYFPCWYRPSTGSPIKTPDNSWKLHNGFLNSKFIDKMKFAICFENSSGVADAQDFKENIVGYWQEHYFKNPSYLLIDNKPVIGIWSPDRLAKQLGGDDMNKKVFDEIEEMLIKEGFSGAIYLGYFNGGDKGTAEKNKMRGYDYSYMYGYGDNSDINSQISNLSKQRTTNVVDAIPMLSQGWGAEAWGQNVRKYNLSLQDFRRGLDWLKDNYMISMDSDSLASKMLLFGNWNEIGEGHFFLPSKISGFGYLDQIREVFSKSPKEHEDFIPNETYDYLSPILWWN